MIKVRFRESGQSFNHGFFSESTHCAATRGQSLTTNGEPLLDPYRLRESAVAGHVPYFEADPPATLELDRHFQFSSAECFRVQKVDSRSERLLPVAADDFRKGQREGPLERRGNHRLGRRSTRGFYRRCAIHHVPAAFPVHPKIRNQHLTR